MKIFIFPSEYQHISPTFLENDVLLNRGNASIKICFFLPLIWHIWNLKWSAVDLSYEQRLCLTVLGQKIKIKTLTPLIGARAIKMANIIPVKSIRLRSCGNIFLLVPIFFVSGKQTLVAPFKPTCLITC